MKYLLLCNRHNSMYGENWALFWGCRESKGGYNTDLRTAHRFTEEEVKQYQDDRDIPIPIDVLGIQEEYESEETINKNIAVIIEKGTLNKLLNLELRPLFQEEEVPENLICPECGGSLSYEQNGSEAPLDEEWMECAKCDYTRELNDDDIELFYRRE